MGDSPATWRLFIAVPVPPAVQRHLGATQRRLMEHGLAYRWIRPYAVHLTIAFLGDTHLKRVSAIARVMDEATAGMTPLALAAGNTGAFPSMGRPQVLWAGVHGDVAALGGLERRLRAGLQAEGIVLEARPFRPHITLGRAIDHQPPPLPESAFRVVTAAPPGHLPGPSVGNAPPGHLPGTSVVDASGTVSNMGGRNHRGYWQAEMIELIRSELQPGGSVYTTIATTPLGTEATPPHDVPSSRAAGERTGEGGPVRENGNRRATTPGMVHHG